MAQKNNALIVFGSLVVIGSVGYYLWSKSKKSKGEGSSEPTPNDKPEVGKGTTEPPKGKGTTEPPKGGKGKVDELTIPTWLSTTEKIKYFQDWLDANYPKWLKGKQLKQGSGWGKLGPSTKSAWDSYGTQFINAQRLAMTKTKFKNSQFVTAKNTFTASAVIFRNGKYMSTDGGGNALPTRKYNATADLGFIKEILANGNIILTVPPEIGPTFGTRIYTDIWVKPTDIE
jgi:hypothetical protein